MTAIALLLASISLLCMSFLVSKIDKLEKQVKELQDKAGK